MFLIMFGVLFYWFGVREVGATDSAYTYSDRLVLELNKYDGKPVQVILKNGVMNDVYYYNSKGEKRGVYVTEKTYTNMLTIQRYLSSHLEDTGKLYVDILTDGSAPIYEINDGSVDTPFDFSSVNMSAGNMITANLDPMVIEDSYAKVFLKRDKSYLIDGMVTDFSITDPSGQLFYENRYVYDNTLGTVKDRAHYQISKVLRPKESGVYLFKVAPSKFNRKVAVESPEMLLKISEADVSELTLSSSELYSSREKAYTYLSPEAPLSYNVKYGVITNVSNSDARTMLDFRTKAFNRISRTGYADNDNYEEILTSNLSVGVSTVSGILYPEKTNYAYRVVVKKGLLNLSGLSSSTIVVKDTGTKSFVSVTGDASSDYLKGANAYDRSLSEIGDPVDAYRGNFLDRRDLLTYGGGFKFSMSYDSIANSSRSLASGFVHNFETYVDKTVSDRMDVYWNPNARTRFVRAGDSWVTADGRRDLTFKEIGTGYEVLDGRIRYEFDVDGKLVSVTDEQGLTTRYDYAVGKLSRVTNARGQWFDFSYSGDRLVSVTDRGGRVVKFAYTSGLLTRVTYANGKYLDIGYQSDMELRGTTRKVSTLTYDGVLLVSNTYNVLGAVSEQSDGERRVTKYTYDEWSVPGEVTTYLLYGDGTTESKTHDREGHMIRFKDENGRVTSYEYDRFGDKTKETDALGNDTLFEYDNQGQVTRTVLADGSELFYEYDGDGNMVKSTDTDGLAMTYTYDEFGRVTSMIDKQGVTTTFAYDALGNVKKQTVGDREINREYDVRGNLTLLTLADGTTSALAYDDLDRQKKMTTGDTSIATDYDVMGNVTRVTSPDGTYVSSTYDSFGNKLSETDKRGNVTNYTYNLNGMLLTEKLGNRSVTYTYNNRDRVVSKRTGSVTESYGYDGVGNLTSYTDEVGRVTTTTYDDMDRVTSTKLGKDTTRYEYDVLGRVVKRVDPLGNATTTTYNRLGLKASETSPEGRKIDFGYDDMGRLTTTTDALGNVSSVSYDVNGQKSKVTDALGNETSFKYDKNGRLIETTNALGEKSYMSYDALGRVSETRNNRGELLTKMTYDASGRVSIATDGNGNTKRFVYDANGNVLGVYDGYNNLIESKTYNEFNEVLTSINALNNTTTNVYDNRGNLTKQTDARLAATTYTYENDNQLSYSTDPYTNSATNTYDDKGRTKTMTFGSFSNRYDYDANDRLITETMPGGNTLTYGYSADGLLTERKNGRGDVSNYTYDLNGNVLTEITKEGTKTHTYDALGRVTKTVDPSGTITRKYDALGRVTEKTFNGKTIGYEYDDRGNLVTMTYPDGKQVKYTYDVVGNMLTVTDWNANVTEYAYDANNRLVTTTNANGTIETRTYNVAGQMTELKTMKGSTVVANYTYVYDANGNITKETDVKRSKVNTYVFDKLDRLTNANANTYAYSATGNVTSYSVSVNGVTSNKSLTYNADNQLSKVGSDLTNVDKDGNLITYKLNGVTYVATYNSRNQLIQYDNQFYSYDAEGNRVGIRQSNGSGVTTSTTSFVVDNDSDRLSRVLVESSESGDVYYVYGNGLISEQRGGNVNTYHFDYRGSTVAMTKGDGTVIGEASYDEYGVKLGSTITTRFAYNGKFGVEDDGTGLYQMRSRYYNVDLKKFMNRDVVVGTSADSQSLNRYAYVNGNPINYTDPFGMAREVIGEYKTDIERLHMLLDLVGLVDGIWGTAADGLNSLIYLAEGNYNYSLLSFGSMAPGLGRSITIEKYIEKISGRIPTIESILKDRLYGYKKYADKVLDYEIVTGKSFATNGFGRLPEVTTLREQYLLIKSKFNKLPNGKTADEVFGMDLTERFKTVKKKEKKDFVVNPVIEHMYLQIPNSDLIPPKKRGNAPISKIDGEKIEIHHVNQSRYGPFVEMHQKHHRGKIYHKLHHPKKRNDIDRNEFNKWKLAYWEHEWDRGRWK